MRASHHALLALSQSSTRSRARARIGRCRLMAMMTALRSALPLQEVCLPACQAFCQALGDCVAFSSGGCCFPYRALCSDQVTGQPSARLSLCCTPSLPSVGVLIWMWRGRQHNGSLADGYNRRIFFSSMRPPYLPLLQMPLVTAVSAPAVRPGTTSRQANRTFTTRSRPALAAGAGRSCSRLRCVRSVALHTRACPQ